MNKRTKALCGIALVFPSAYFLVYLVYGICALISVLLPLEYEYDFIRVVGILLPQMALGEAWLAVEHIAMCVPAVFALIAYRFVDLSYAARRLWLWLPLGLGLLNAVCLVLSAVLQSGLPMAPALYLSPLPLIVWFGQNIWLLRRAKTETAEAKDAAPS